MSSPQGRRGKNIPFIQEQNSKNIRVLNCSHSKLSRSQLNLLLQIANFFTQRGKFFHVNKHKYVDNVPGNKFTQTHTQTKNPAWEKEKDTVKPNRFKVGVQFFHIPVVKRGHLSFDCFNSSLGV